MSDGEYAYAQNWIEQFRLGLRNAEFRGTRNNNFDPHLSLRENMDHAYLNLFWWDGTPEHDRVWRARHFEIRDSLDPPTAR